MSKTSLCKFKKDSQEEAMSIAIPVLENNSLDQIAYLVPVGKWVLEGIEFAELVSIWRNRNMRFFLTRFEANIQNSWAYLNGKAEPASNDLFFFIIGVDGKVIGHIGLADIEGDSAEIDNLMLGEATKHVGLMDVVENTLIDWANLYLGVKKFHLRVLSYNFLAINLHLRCGFQIDKEVSLKKSTTDDVIQFIECQANESDVEFKCLKLSKTF